MWEEEEQSNHSKECCYQLPENRQVCQRHDDEYQKYIQLSLMILVCVCVWVGVWMCGCVRMVSMGGCGVVSKYMQLACL